MERSAEVRIFIGYVTNPDGEVLAVLGTIQPDRTHAMEVETRTLDYAVLESLEWLGRAL